MIDEDTFFNLTPIQPLTEAEVAQIEAEVEAFLAEMPPDELAEFLQPKQPPFWLENLRRDFVAKRN